MSERLAVQNPMLNMYKTSAGNTSCQTKHSVCAAARAEYIVPTLEREAAVLDELFRANVG